jgi:hypothetical protein
MRRSSACCNILCPDQRLESDAALGIPVEEFHQSITEHDAATTKAIQPEAALRPTLQRLGYHVRPTNSSDPTKPWNSGPRRP